MPASARHSLSSGRSSGLNIDMIRRLNIAVLVDQRLGHEGRVFFGVVVPFPDLVGVKSVGANPPSDWDSDQGAFCLKVGF